MVALLASAGLSSHARADDAPVVPRPLTHSRSPYDLRADEPFARTTVESKHPIDRHGLVGPDHSSNSGSGVTGVLAGLAVLALFVLAAGRWLRQRQHPAIAGRLPPQAIERLGMQPLSPQLAIHLVRIGDRILVLGSGADGLRTLSEITDPAEQAHLIHLCHEDQSTYNWWPSLGSWRRAPLKSPPANESHSRQRVEVAPSPAEAPLPSDRSHALPPDARRFPRGIKTAAILCGLTLTGPSLSAQERSPSYAGTAPASQGTQFLFLASERESAERSQTTVLPQTISEQSPLQSATHVNSKSPLHAAASPGGVPNHFSRSPASLTEPPSTTAQTGGLAGKFGSLISGSGLGGTLQLGLVIGVMSLAPAILLMTTCYVRMIVVLGLLRQALGVSQFPPTQVLTALALFLTALVMWPIWSRAYHEGVEPYAQTTSADAPPSAAQLTSAWTATVRPLREFMSRQIEATGNVAALDLFLQYQSAHEAATPAVEYYEDVPLEVLLPAYVLSELKTAFLLGFQIYLPFVVIDLVVASVLTSLGLTTLPASAVALPFKLLLFVLIDGWFLTVELLLQSLSP